MAKVKFSALVSEMRNKLNGSVFSKNRAGNYLRNKVTPVNPRTVLQQNVRGRFGSLSSSWRGLTEAERQSWIDKAVEFPYNDIFGDQKILTGLQLYVKLNSNLEQAGESPLTNAPSPQPVTQLLALQATYDDTAGSEELMLNMNYAGVLPSTGIFVYATPPVGAGISFVKNLYRFIAHESPNPATLDIYADYVARFGEIGTGQKVFIRVACINELTGQVGTALETMVIAP